MIKSLQGLRALAMIAIFLFHSGFIPNGIFPVTFFFILSGFVVYYNYSTKIDNATIIEGIKWGMVKIKKLYPIHILTFIMSIFIRWAWVVKNTIGELILMGIVNVTLMQSIVQKYSLTFNSASWYLSTTLICYLVALFLISKLKKINYNISFLILILFIELILALVVPNIIQDYNYVLYISPYVRVLDFFIGMIIAKLYIEGDCEKKRNYNAWEFITIILFGVSYISSFILPSQFTRGLIYLPVFSLGIYYMAFEKGIISKFLCNDIFQKIARISFEFYMVHELILILFRNIFKSLEAHWILKNIIIATPAFVITYIIAMILNTYVTNRKRKAIARSIKWN